MTTHQGSATVQTQLPDRVAYGVLIGTWGLGQLLLLTFRPGYMFPPFDQVDTWFYTAYQWNWSQMITEFGSTYYGARVSSLFVGVLFHTLFDPTIANILTKLFFSGGLAIGLGWFGLRFGGLLPGVIGVALAVFSPQVIIALHGDYTDSAVLVYATLSVAAITQAGLSSHPFRWIFLAGVAFTFMAVANLGSLGNIGLAVALFHLAWLDRPLVFHGKCLLVYGAAAVAAGGSLHLLNSYLGASWDLISPQWRLVAKLNNLGTENPWYVAGWAWMVRSTWLVVPVSALIWGAYRSYFAPLANPLNQRLVSCLTAGLGFAWLVGLILELRGSQVIGLFYYASALLALALPLLLLLLEPAIMNRTKTLTGAAVGFGLLAFVALFSRPVAYAESTKWLRDIAGESEAVLWLGWGILIAAYAIWAVVARGPKARPVIPALLLISGIVYLSIPRTYQHFSYADRLSERYQLIHDTIEFVEDNFPPNGYRFWIDRDFSDSATLVSSRLWGYRLWTEEPFPQLSSSLLNSPPVIVPRPLGEAPEAITQVRAALDRVSLYPDNLRVHTISADHGIGFDLIIFTPVLAQIDPDDLFGLEPAPQMIAGFEYQAGQGYTAELQIFDAAGSSAKIETRSDVAFFSRGAWQDHAFSHYRPLPQATGLRRLAVDIYVNAPGELTITLEDDFGSTFETLSITAPGRTFRVVAVPPDASHYRFKFFSRGNDSAPLPNNLNVFYLPPSNGERADQYEPE
jgi:hypothetical protein